MFPTFYGTKACQSSSNSYGVPFLESWRHPAMANSIRHTSSSCFHLLESFEIVLVVVVFVVVVVVGVVVVDESFPKFSRSLEKNKIKIMFLKKNLKDLFG